jgi:chorismate synthase
LFPIILWFALIDGNEVLPLGAGQGGRVLELSRQVAAGSHVDVIFQHIYKVSDVEDVVECSARKRGMITNLRGLITNKLVDERYTTAMRSHMTEHEAHKTQEK